MPEAAGAPAPVTPQYDIPPPEFMPICSDAAVPNEQEQDTNGVIPVLAPLTTKRRLRGKQAGFLSNMPRDVHCDARCMWYV